MMDELCRRVKEAHPEIVPMNEQLVDVVEEFIGWWSLNRDEGSVNRAYDYIDKITKRLRAANQMRRQPQRSPMRGPGVLEPMNVYLLYVFDSMASNWGEYTIDAVYRSEADAHTERDNINERIRREQPHNKYPSLAQVRVMELK